MLLDDDVSSFFSAGGGGVASPSWNRFGCGAFAVSFTARLVYYLLLTIGQSTFLSFASFNGHILLTVAIYKTL